MADRRVKVIFSAEIQGFKQAMAAAEAATVKAKKASEAAGKASDKAAADIDKQALAHHAAAKAAGLQYDNTGQLVTMNGKAVTSQQAATHGLETFSKEAYLAGRAAVSAGEDAEAAAKVAAEAEKKAAEAIKKRREAMELIGPMAMTAGAATLAGVGLAIKSYADFDKQMSSVDAATHETAGNMQLLREAAVDAGADTAFSAVEAAQGIEEMAKAGVSTADILGGGLNGTLALAAAGALGVGEASEIAASAMVQFGLKGKDIPHIADLLAAAAGKAQGSVQDMGLALSYAGVPAAGLGISIEQTTGTIAMLAKAGIVGEKAGTALRAMLVSMVKPAENTQKKMDELGISFSTANGEFIGLDAAAQVLKDELGGVDEMTRNATLAQIFGNEALGAAQTLYKNGAAGVQEMTAAVDDYGYAADTAARMQNNLAGDLEKLGGSFDTVLIQSGSGANEVLRGLVQGLEDVVDIVGQVPAPVLGAVTGLAALVGGAALIGGTLITVIPKIKETRDALNELAPAGGKARGALDKAGKVAEIAGAAFVALAIAAKLASDAADSDRAKTNVEDFSNALAGVTTRGDAAKKALDGAFNGVTKPGSSSFTAVNDLDSALKRVFNPTTNDNMNDFWSTVTGNNATSGMNATKAALADMDASIASMAKSGNLEDAASGFTLAAKAAEEQGIPIEKLVELFPEYKEAVLAAKTANGETQVSQEALTEAMLKADPAGRNAAAAQEILDQSLQDTGVALGAVIEDMDKFLEQLFAAGLATMSARDANSAYHEALRGVPETLKTIAESNGEMGRTLNKNATDFDTSTKAGSLANAAFQDIARSGMAEVEAMSKEGLGQDELQGKLGTTYDDLVKAADGMGITGTKAHNLAREILGVPKGVSIDSWMSSAAKSTAEKTKTAIDNIPKSTSVDVFVNTHETLMQKAIRGSAAPQRGPFLPPEATGGKLLGFSDGGQLPSSGPGTGVTDGFLGVSSAGVPVARLDANEWIINGRSSDRYNRELSAINAGTFPKLPGYANGGKAREYSARELGYAPAGAASSAMSIDLSGATYQALDPGALRQEVLSDIKWELQKQGVRLGG